MSDPRELVNQLYDEAEYVSYDLAYDVADALTTVLDERDRLRAALEQIVSAEGPWDMAKATAWTAIALQEAPK